MNSATGPLNSVCVRRGRWVRCGSLRYDADHCGSFSFRVVVSAVPARIPGTPRRGRSVAMRIPIVGAGIGGLTAALALRQAGFDPHVYEQASVLREVGAGVAISPNAVKILHRLGLAEALRGIGVVSH